MRDPFTGFADWQRRPYTQRRRTGPRRSPRLERLEDRAAPSVDFAFAMGIGSTGFDEAVSVAVDADGNTYTTGTFENTVDFDPRPETAVALTSAGGMDVYIVKYDPAGNLGWVCGLSGTNHDFGRDIALDSQGGVYITGKFSGTVDFNPDPGVTHSLTTAGTGTDTFVLKLDEGGTFRWVRSVSSASAQKLAVGREGDVYVVGEFGGTVDFDSNPATTEDQLTANGQLSDIFVWKLDTNGGFGWSRSFGSAGTDSAMAIALDGAENVYTTGLYRSGSNDFNPGAGTLTLPFAGVQDIFLSKLDSSGNLAWARGIGGAASETGHGLAADAAGNVVLVWCFVDPGTNRVSRA